jgi:GT2 family glycosyltransferase
MNDKLVSIIIPAKNSEKYIKNSILSILRQSYKVIEIIVILDNCSDSSELIVNSLKRKDSRIRAYKLKGVTGVANARNLGLKLSHGRYIAFCDSDDLWTPKKIEKQLKLIRKNNAPISHGSAILIDENGAKLGIRMAPRFVNYNMLRYRNFLINSSCLVDIKKTGALKQKNIPHEDYNMWLSIFKKSFFSISPCEPILYYRIHKNNLTSNKFKSVAWMIKIQRLHGISLLEIFINLFKNFHSRVSI